MGMKEYREAVEIMKVHSDKTFFAGPKPQSLIEAAEKALDLKFPPTYRQFLLDYGAGNFGASEIYGVTRDNFETASVPNGIWYTLTERKEIELPKNLVIIYETGDGEFFCLDLSEIDFQGEAPIITFQPGYSVEEQNREVIAKDFGMFLYEIVQREIKS